MNTIIISGYIQGDLKLSTSSGGKEYCSFTVYNKTGSGNYANANYFNCVCFGASAKNLCTYKKKGDYIYIVGEVNIKKYEAKDGTKKDQISITALNLDFPPAAKVSATDIERPYNQNIPDQIPFTQDDVFSQTGMDGSVNPQQVAKSMEKPFKDFSQLSGNFDISGDDLPF